jgi:hypothetical protein
MNGPRRLATRNGRASRSAERVVRAPKWRSRMGLSGPSDPVVSFAHARDEAAEQLLVPNKFLKLTKPPIPSRLSRPGSEGGFAA